jgi:hypothetical protein
VLVGLGVLLESIPLLLERVWRPSPDAGENQVWGCRTWPSVGRTGRGNHVRVAVGPLAPHRRRRALGCIMVGEPRLNSTALALADKGRSHSEYTAE